MNSQDTHIIRYPGCFLSSPVFFNWFPSCTFFLVPKLHLGTQFQRQAPLGYLFIVVVSRESNGVILEKNIQWQRL